MYISEPASARERFPQMEEALAARINPTFLHGGLPCLILKYEQPGQPQQVSIGVAGLADSLPAVLVSEDVAAL